MSCFIFFINLNLLKPLLIIDFFSMIIVYIFIKFSNLYIITGLETNLNLFKLPKCFYNVYILFSMFVKKNYKQNSTQTTCTRQCSLFQENVANKSLYDHSEESVDYCHIYDEARDALTQDGVYHHLNEEEQKQDDSNFDHASAAVGHVTDLNEYSVISDIKTDETVSPTEENDEYFVLEQSFSKDGLQLKSQFYQWIVVYPLVLYRYTLSELSVLLFKLFILVSYRDSLFQSKVLIPDV